MANTGVVPSVRRWIAGLFVVALALPAAGCIDVGPIIGLPPSPPAEQVYAAVSDDGFEVPAVPLYKIDPIYRRAIVGTPARVAEVAKTPGTIVVDPQYRHLYFVQADGTSIRYGIGVGREGFEWSGNARVGAKREWPRWTPPPEMIGRQPELVKYRNGMDPGLTNPLGARALYLYNKSGDTGYRLHGSPEWWSIGKAVSSGCIRLINQDIIDLYNRASVGAKVIVK